jgi:hypothetical protein
MGAYAIASERPPVAPIGRAEYFLKKASCLLDLGVATLCSSAILQKEQLAELCERRAKGIEAEYEVRKDIPPPKRTGSISPWGEIADLVRWQAYLIRDKLAPTYAKAWALYSKAAKIQEGIAKCEREILGYENPERHEEIARLNAKDYSKSGHDAVFGAFIRAARAWERLDEPAKAEELFYRAAAQRKCRAEGDLQAKQHAIDSKADKDSMWLHIDSNRSPADRIEYYKQASEAFWKALFFSHQGGWHKEGNLLAASADCDSKASAIREMLGQEMLAQGNILQAARLFHEASQDSFAASEKLLRRAHAILGEGEFLNTGHRLRANDSFASAVAAAKKSDRFAKLASAWCKRCDQPQARELESHIVEFHKAEKLVAMHVSFRQVVFGSADIDVPRFPSNMDLLAGLNRTIEAAFGRELMPEDVVRLLCEERKKAEGTRTEGLGIERPSHEKKKLDVSTGLQISSLHLEPSAKIPILADFRDGIKVEPILLQSYDGPSIFESGAIAKAGFEKLN